MKSNFAENIKALRKERQITQEQLAEAMGVSSGAIYKWEQAISTPDIEVIMEIARFFGVSVDALVGFQVCISDKERIVKALKNIKLDKCYEDRWEEVEGWLRRYPNDFEIVYHSGVLYNLAGIETGNKQYLSRSIALMNHACSLLSQNRDPQISKTSLSRDMAFAYLLLGEDRRGLELLKSQNPCGINDDVIGQELATVPGHRADGLPYLSAALLRCTASLYRVVIGYLNLFFDRKDYAAAAWMLQWFSGYLDGLKTERGVSYLDKDNALLQGICGAVYGIMGQEEQARVWLQKARKLAMEFDAAPDYTSRNIRYCEAEEPRVAYDNIGCTAMDSIQNFLREGICSEGELGATLWGEICHEA